MAAIKIFLLTLLFLALLESAICAETTIEMLGNVMLQEGLGGKQVIDGSGDQRLELYEPMVFIDTQLGDNTRLHLQGVYDSFTSASARLFDARSGASQGTAKLFDAATGASGTPTPVPTRVGTPRPGATPTPGPTPGGTGAGPVAAAVPPQIVWESRRALDVGISQKMGTWVVSPSGGYSTAAVYVSKHGGLNLQKSFAEDNFTVSLGGFYYQDAILVYDLRSGSFTGWTPRLTRSANFSVSQILGPADLVLVGGSFTRQSGFLSSILNTVAVPQGRTQEVLPDNRNKITGTVRYVHGFTPLLAFHFDYRYYTDDWGIGSDTFEPSLVIGSEDEAGLFQVAFRFYQQRGTFYYGESFPGEGGFMTSDSDLQSLLAREIRIHFSQRWEIAAWLQSLTFKGTVSYYTRSNDLRAWIIQAGLSEGF